MIQTLWLNFIGGSIFALLGFGLSRVLKRNDIADFLWGLGFILIAIVHAMASEALSFRSAVVLVLVSLWGLRLSIFLGFRVFKKKTEDIRYANWRRDWGSREPLMAFGKIFALQGCVMIFVALPVGWVFQSGTSPLSPWDFAGLIIFTLGFLIESVADSQLAKFKKDPASQGRPMTKGLWAYSRHPNYFGEILIWWGFFLLCMGTSGGWITVISPLLMTYLLIKVSGVAMLDRLLKERGPEYQKYIAGTPSLLPINKQNLISFLIIFVSLVVLDFVWLGNLMNSFYLLEAAPVARMTAEGGWDVLLWPAGWVYFFLALGIQFFALTHDRATSFFRGALFGLCVYGVYEMTNLSLLKNWPWAMALVDIGWGVALCGLSAAAASRGSISKVKNLFTSEL